jgi:NAD(P)-dependent dehydrogenase (short-subunit alcohol dehydrogenase family)
MTVRKAVISGASKGIGYAIAERLAADGADVGLLASNAARLKDAADRIHKETGKRVACHAVDLRTLQGCEEAHREMAAALGGCDILVNSAGATKGGVWPEQADEEWEDGFALKFYAAVRLARLFWPALVAARGTVINIVGGFARTPAADFMVGGVVNAALANFSKALAAQGLRDDVNVNWVHPGLTVTERLDGIFDGRAKQQGKTRDQVEEETIAHEGIRRLGQPEDVAALVAFLCSDQARHIQGTAIQIDGGGTPGYY